MTYFKKMNNAAETKVISGRKCQLVEIEGRQIWAIEASFLVIGDHGHVYHGGWQTKHEAASFGFGWRAVRHVTPYLYIPSWGVVPN